MTAEAIEVCVFAAPDASCGGGMTCSAASAFIGERLKRRLANAVRVEHIEIFCPRTLDFPQIVAVIEAGMRIAAGQIHLDMPAWTCDMM